MTDQMDELLERIDKLMIDLAQERSKVFNLQGSLQESQRMIGDLLDRLSHQSDY